LSRTRLRALLEAAPQHATQIRLAIRLVQHCTIVALAKRNPQR
jgi:hypothetical protein